MEIDSQLLYFGRGMVDTSADTHVQHQNGTNHEETNCGMDCTVSKLYRIVFGV